MSLKGEIWTLREVRKITGTSLTVDDFVVKLGNIPSVEIPTHLMSEQQAERATVALEGCQQVVGYYGDKRSKFKDEKFLDNAKEFKLATGVDAGQVIQRLRDDLIPDNQCF